MLVINASGWCPERQPPMIGPIGPGETSPQQKSAWADSLAEPARRLPARQTDNDQYQSRARLVPRRPGGRV